VFICKRCGVEILENAYRFAVHLSVCKKATAEDKALAAKQLAKSKRSQNGTPRNSVPADADIYSYGLTNRASDYGFSHRYSEGVGDGLSGKRSDSDGKYGHASEIWRSKRPSDSGLGVAARFGLPLLEENKAGFWNSKSFGLPFEEDLSNFQAAQRVCESPAHAVEPGDGGKPLSGSLMHDLYGGFLGFLENTEASHGTRSLQYVRSARSLCPEPSAETLLDSMLPAGREFSHTDTLASTSYASPAMCLTSAVGENPHSFESAFDAVLCQLPPRTWPAPTIPVLYEQIPVAEGYESRATASASGD